MEVLFLVRVTRRRRLNFVLSNTVSILGLCSRRHRHRTSLVLVPFLVRTWAVRIWQHVLLVQFHVHHQGRRLVGSPDRHGCAALHRAPLSPCRPRRRIHNMVSIAFEDPLVGSPFFSEVPFLVRCERHQSRRRGVPFLVRGVPFLARSRQALLSLAPPSH